MHSIVQTYGKQLISELMDMIIISKYVDHTKARDLLIKYDLIKKSTKTIIADYTFKNNYWGNGNHHHLVNMKNGRNQSILRVSFRQSDIPQILEDIK